MATDKISSGLLPQLLNEIQESDILKYINDSAYCAQEKHDGKRRILRYQYGKVEGINKKGHIVGFPFVFEKDCIALAKLNDLSEFTLDGEEVGETFFTFESWFTIAFRYLIITITLSIIVNILENRFRIQT